MLKHQLFISFNHQVKLFIFIEQPAGLLSLIFLYHVCQFSDLNYQDFL